MSSLSIVETKLPPGFRFHPRDEELICDYLMKWITGSPHPLPLLISVDLNKCEPWDIPEFACVGGKEWYFYSQRDRKYATGLRTNRATVSGYWKATGKDRPIIRKGILVGMRKTLVFYQGRAPKGRKTDWVMHEFRIEGLRGPAPKSPSPLKEDWVLCRVFFKSRSEIPAAKTEEGGNDDVVSPSSLLPPLTDHAVFFNDEYDHEQVPCFSIFNTNPSFSLLGHMDMEAPPPQLQSQAMMLPELEMYGSHDPDKKMIMTKMESGNNEETIMSIKGGSPSFGEGSSDSYHLSSEVVWNNYS